MMKVLDALFNANASVQDAETEPAYAAPLRRGDFGAAAPLLLAAMAKDDARAMGTYAAMCALGRGVEQNLQEAYCWFLQGATRDDTKSQVALGMCLAGGMGTTVNLKEAAYWLYRAGKAGSLDAIAILGDLAYEDHAIVGPHFTEDELIDLVYHFRNETVRRIASRSSRRRGGRHGRNR